VSLPQPLTECYCISIRQRQVDDDRVRPFEAGEGESGLAPRRGDDIDFILEKSASRDRGASPRYCQRSHPAASSPSRRGPCSHCSDRKGPNRRPSVSARTGPVRWSRHRERIRAAANMYRVIEWLGVLTCLARSSVYGDREAWAGLHVRRCQAKPRADLAQSQRILRRNGQDTRSRHGSM